MATPEQRRTLLATACPWCHAQPGNVCTRGRGGKRDVEGGVRKQRPLLVTTLDGGCHDARWQAAGLGTAPVVAERVRELHPVAAGPPVGPVADRPW